MGLSSKGISFLLTTFVCIVSFQNCTSGVQFDKNTSLALGTGGGGGNGIPYEGILFANGTCPDSRVATRIRLERNGEAQMIRNNCSDLVSPILLDASSYTLVGNPIASLVYQNQTFLRDDSKIEILRSGGFGFNSFPTTRTTISDYILNNPGSSPKSGSLMVCSISYSQDNSSVTGLVDSNGNVFQRAHGRLTYPTLMGHAVELWYKENYVSTESVMFTATFSGSGSYELFLSCYEYDGIASSNALNGVFGSNGGPGVSQSLGSFQSTGKDLLFATTFFEDANGSSNFRFLHQNATGYIWDNILSQFGIYTFNFSATSEWTAIVARFNGK